MLTMIYMTRIQNMSFFISKVNNPSVRHPVWPVRHSIWPRRAPVWPPPSGHPVWPPLGTPSGPIWPPIGHPVQPPSSRKKISFLFYFIFGCYCPLEKRAKNISVFNPQDPQDPRVPRAPRASRAKPREEEGFFGLIPLVTHPSSIPLLGGLTPKFLSLSFHSL
jgi:hypothetical protein